MKTTGTREVRLRHRQIGKCERFSAGLAAGAALFAVFLFVFAVSPLSAAPAQGSAPASVSTETIHYDSGGFQIDGFLAKPEGG
jgi:hypothetical protein